MKQVAVLIAVMFKISNMLNNPADSAPHETQNNLKYFLQMRKIGLISSPTSLLPETQCCQHVTLCLSSSVLCSFVPIPSTVQVGALGIVSMDTKQLAWNQNRTLRVAYSEALGARKS